MLNENMPKKEKNEFANVFISTNHDEYIQCH